MDPFEIEFSVPRSAAAQQEGLGRRSIQHYRDACAV